MDVIKLTRELGAAIQKDERYLKFAEIREANEKDTELNDLMGKIQLVQMNYQREASQENPDSQKMGNYELEFNDLYSKFMQNENMVAYEAARKEIDDLMNYIMGILGLCVNGNDPETCEPEQPHDHDCSGCSCDECGGGCH